MELTLALGVEGVNLLTALGRIPHVAEATLGTDALLAELLQLGFGALHGHLTAVGLGGLSVDLLSCEHLGLDGIDAAGLALEGGLGGLLELGDLLAQSRELDGHGVHSELDQLGLHGLECGLGGLFGLLELGLGADRDFHGCLVGVHVGLVGTVGIVGLLGAGLGDLGGHEHGAGQLASGGLDGHDTLELGELGIDGLLGVGGLELDQLGLGSLGGSLGVAGGVLLGLHLGGGLGTGGLGGLAGLIGGHEAHLGVSQDAGGCEGLLGQLDHLAALVEQGPGVVLPVPVVRDGDIQLPDDPGADGGGVAAGGVGLAGHDDSCWIFPFLAHLTQRPDKGSLHRICLRLMKRMVHIM